MIEEDYIEEVLMLAELKGVRIELLNRVRERISKGERRRKLDVYEEELKWILNNKK